MVLAKRSISLRKAFGWVLAQEIRDRLQGRVLLEFAQA